MIRLGNVFDDLVNRLDQQTLAKVLLPWPSPLQGFLFFDPGDAYFAPGDAYFAPGDVYFA